MWYSVTQNEMIRAGGKRLLDYYNGSHKEALVQIYPELIFKKEKFVLYEGGWIIKSQRKFLDGFARSKNFNPLDVNKWHSVTRKEIIRAGGLGLLKRYKGYVKALVKLYPELMLKQRDFLNSKRGWKESENHRMFFDRFARSKNFNPLDANNWYSVTRSEIIRAGGGRLIKRYKGYAKALVKLYPELMLKK